MNLVQLENIEFFVDMPFWSLNFMISYACWYSYLYSLIVSCCSLSLFQFKLVCVPALLCIGYHAMEIGIISPLPRQCPTRLVSQVMYIFSSTATQAFALYSFKLWFLTFLYPFPLLLSSSPHTFWCAPQRFYICLHSSHSWLHCWCLPCTVVPF